MNDIFFWTFEFWSEWKKDPMEGKDAMKMVSSLSNNSGDVTGRWWLGTPIPAGHLRSKPIIIAITGSSTAMCCSWMQIIIIFIEI